MIDSERGREKERASEIERDRKRKRELKELQRQMHDGLQYNICAVHCSPRGWNIHMTHVGESNRVYQQVASRAVRWHSYVDIISTGKWVRNESVSTVLRCWDVGYLLLLVLRYEEILWLCFQTFHDTYLIEKIHWTIESSWRPSTGVVHLCEDYPQT